MERELPPDRFRPSGPEKASEGQLGIPPPETPESAAGQQFRRLEKDIAGHPTDVPPAAQFATPELPLSVDLSREPRAEQATVHAQELRAALAKYPIVPDFEWGLPRPYAEYPVKTRRALVSLLGALGLAMERRDRQSKLSTELVQLRHLQLLTATNWFINDTVERTDLSPKDMRRELVHTFLQVFSP